MLKYKRALTKLNNWGVRQQGIDLGDLSFEMKTRDERGKLALKGLKGSLKSFEMKTRNNQRNNTPLNLTYNEPLENFIPNLYFEQNTWYSKKFFIDTLKFFYIIQVRSLQKIQKWFIRFWPQKQKDKEI